MADKSNGEKFNATMRKFGAPGSRIRRYEYWSVLLRQTQATLGSLVLIAHEPATAFPQLSRESFTELQIVTQDLESALSTAFEYDKLNYLMLMMVDPDVHFHVLPRYSEARQFEGREFPDPGWPGPPDLTQSTETDETMNRLIQDYIDSCWPA